MSDIDDFRNLRWRNFDGSKNNLPNPDREITGGNFSSLSGPNKKKIFRTGRVWEKLRVYAHQQGLLRAGMAVVAHVLAWLGLDVLKKYRWDAYSQDTLGVVTSGNVARKRLQMDATIKEHAVRYEATPPFEFWHAMSALRIEHDCYRFTDYGSGKGRVLLLASELPFIEIRGVEADRRLHNIACRNIAAFPRERMACRNVESICENAAEWCPPTGPSVVFMFNPFDQVILAPVLRKISLATADSHHTSYLIYKNPVHHETVLSEGNFSIFESMFGNNFIIYKIGR